MFAGEVSEPFKIFELQNTAGRILRRIDDDHFRLRRDLPCKLIKTEPELLRLLEPDGDRYRSRHSNGGLISGVCRRSKDNFVARIDHGMNDGEDHHLGAGRHNNVFPIN